MGLFIEVDGSKLHWLTRNGVMTTQRGIIPDDSFLVCHVDNGHFYAAGVIFDEIEMDRATQRDDKRKKFWFYAKKEVLKEVCPKWDDYISEEV